ncbi:MAG: helix-turn-helix domain-containing protein [Deltaproteobacteria bacterium]|nr:helix-turn-helix domain-containing protein [Deltaproteobacteria bacterium]
MDRTLSISEAARMLGVSEKTIRNRIKRNEIIAELVNGKYAIKEHDLLNSMNGKKGGNVSNLSLVEQIKSENEYLRTEMSKAQEELSEVRQRSDTIIITLTQRLDEQITMLEDMRQRHPLWQRVKARLGSVFGQWNSSNRVESNSL